MSDDGFVRDSDIIGANSFKVRTVHEFLAGLSPDRTSRNLEACKVIEQQDRKSKPDIQKDFRSQHESVRPQPEDDIGSE